MSRAAGASALIGGQSDDLAAEGQGGTLDQLRSIHARKTGALIRVSLRLGAVVAQADESVVERLDRFGRHVGIAFQIVDDLLDHEGDAATIGKRTQKDADRGKLTYPVLLGTHASRRQAEALTESACEEAAAFGESADLLLRYFFQLFRHLETTLA